MPFSNIIGQTSIVSRLMNSVNAQTGVKLAQPIMLGQAGLGKTATAFPYANAIAKKLECEVLVVTPEMMRLDDSPEYQAFINWIHAPTGVLIIDEAHEMSIINTVQMGKILSFLLKALDAQNEGKLLKFDDDNYVKYDKSKKVVVMMTNYTNKMNPALISRMDKCELQEYSHPELEKICIQMLEKNGMVAECEKTIALLAKASRGTARPLYNMIQEFARIGQKTISRELAIKTMRDLDMFPRGLNHHEVHLLEIAKKATTTSIAKMIVQGLATNMSKSVAYLMAHGLMDAKGSGQIQTSKKGVSFLSSLKSLGFIG